MTKVSWETCFSLPAVKMKALFRIVATAYYATCIENDLYFKIYNMKECAHIGMHNISMSYWLLSDIGDFYVNLLDINWPILEIRGIPVCVCVLVFASNRQK